MLTKDYIIDGWKAALALSLGNCVGDPPPLLPAASLAQQPGKPFPGEDRGVLAQLLPAASLRSHRLCLTLRLQSEEGHLEVACSSLHKA